MAADTQVSDTLKKFAANVTTASVKERKEIFGALKLCTKGKELPEPAIKGLVQALLSHAAPIQRCRFPQRAALRHLPAAETQPDVLVTSLLHSLLSSGVISKTATPSKSRGPLPSSGCPGPACWSPLCSRPRRRKGPVWKKMVEVQSLLVADVVGGAKSTAQKSSLKHLSQLVEGSE
ncbi:hypothetical protein KUCAC02_024911 [Chaenocephalus aceratus]|nr:hypothetical protein KUCAC02_024911 [Chaenocephalus aceratus]